MLNLQSSNNNCTPFTSTVLNPTVDQKKLCSNAFTSCSFICVKFGLGPVKGEQSTKLNNFLVS